jgi:putative inorganic carbon (hco3(-)) transporter
VLVLWPLVAFGGRSAATALSFGAVCILGAALTKPYPRFSDRLDRALVIVLVVVALPMLPLPAPLAALLSPRLQGLRETLTLGAGQLSAWRALSIDPSSTAWALIVVAGAVALFWFARACFATAGLRLTIRLLATVGFGVSLLAIAQAATAGRNIYWRFPTEVEGPLPFGPFINRNHFATWVIMALPLCLGYLAARTGRPVAHSDYVPTRTRLAHAIDPRTAWLITASTTMLAALLLSLSRSGALALGVSIAATMIACRQRIDRRRRRALLATAGIVLLLGLAWADLPALRARVAGTQSGLANRFTIWRETMPVVRDFWLTGTGAGTYQTAMLRYQKSGRVVYFNQAHNHYLQIASEGGVVLIAAGAVALVALVLVGRQRIRHDGTGLVWIRIGAAAGLTAVALQSIWETGLVMPANAALAAVLAAVLTHEKKR